MILSKARIAELCWFLLAVAAVWLWMAHPAFAQASGGWGNFACSNGQASGTLYDPGTTCPTTIKTTNIFSFLVCNMEHLSANLMGAMYCGVVNVALPAVEATLTLAVVFFGIGFTTGVVPATAREFQLFMVKIAFVWIFATQADYMIGVGYRFLVEGMREGVVIALSGVFHDENGTHATGAKIYEFFDKFLGKTLQYASANVGIDFNDPNQNPCKNAIFSVIAVMMLVFPPLFYVSVALMLKVALTFVRAVFGYIYALVGLVFLITMAPLFLCFSLFRQTAPFFNKWLGYLVSFSLQIVIVFAFLGAIVTIDVKHITSSFTDIIVPSKRVNETSSFRFPWQYCTICDFEVVKLDDNGNETNEVFAANEYRGIIDKAKLRCKNGDNPVSPFDTVGPRDKKGQQQVEDSIRNSLLRFVSTALLSLFVLAYVVDALLKFIPGLAQFLAGGMGGTYAPQLGGGDAAFSGRPVAEMPGNRLIDTAERGFTDGYVNSMREGGIYGTPGAIVGGFKEASIRMLFGDRAYTTDVTNRFTGNRYDDPGLVGSFFEFMVNPLGEVADY